MGPPRVTHDLTERIEDLVRQTDSIPDPHARDLAINLVSAVMELHGAALARIVALLQKAENNARLIEAMAADEFVSAVLALHDVHPHALDTRLARVIEALRQELKAGEMDLELKESDPHRIKVHLSGGRPAARAAARHWIQSAIYEAVPEIDEIVIYGVEDNLGFVPIESLLASREAV